MRIARLRHILKVKYLIAVCAVFFCVVGSVSKADYSGFLDQLKTMNIPVETIMTAQGVSRYDLARLLNAVECKDCVRPAQDMIDRYTNTFWSQFLGIQGEDFGDINYLGGIFNQTSYYYCAAYVGDNGYMNGYPAATSPICAGKFCGNRNVTKAEFIQVGINLVAKYIYKDFSLNWKDAKTWLNGLNANDYAAKTFTNFDKQIINSGVQTCGGTSCPLKSANEVKTYLKYCMFNLSSCAMGDIGTVKQGYRPVAELNLLYKQNIIDLQEAQKEDINQVMDGNRILAILYNLYKTTGCTFHNDYDCDGVDNAHDSCPNAYNPSQRDIDQDGIGDVCDDDIDNDGAKNPIGIVDDNGNFNVSALKGWTGTLDNCLFIPNADQSHTPGDTIGSACKGQDKNLSLYIKVGKITGSAPLTTSFEAVTKGNHKDISWDMGDGTQNSGTIITHTFATPGMYLVKAFAPGNGSNDANASIMIIVGGSMKDQQALQIKANKIGGALPLEISFSASFIGDADSIEWNWDGTHITHSAPNDVFIHRFSTGGDYPISVKMMKNNEIIGVSAFVIGAGDTSRGSLLKSTSLNPDMGKDITLTTTIFGFPVTDIAEIYREFGDGTHDTNTQLTLTHTFNKRGTKVVVQKITLKDGSTFTNFVTLYIVDKSLMASYALQNIISPLNPNSLEKIDSAISIVGDTIGTPITFLKNYEPGITAKLNTSLPPKSSSYVYSKGGIYYPQTTLYVNACRYLQNQSTLAVDGVDICQSSLSRFHCDEDKDGIPDICDDDIDGDGIKNLIGIIRFEHADCSLGADNLNIPLLAKQYKGSCSMDNAPFTPNADQRDLNADGFGDTANAIDTGLQALLTNTSYAEKDTDGDGIPDSKDLCPTVKENYNGIDDYDGCPEIGQELACEGQGPNVSDVLAHSPFISEVCNSCPCQFTDVTADLTNKDQIKAVLRDANKLIPYTYSLPEPFTID